MRKVVRHKATALPGGKIEIVDERLPVGGNVDVVVSPASLPERRSAIDILNEAPGGLAFKMAAGVAAYLKEERESWDR